MIPNLEKVGGDTTALNDPRITRVGRYIRKCKFDELPQLLNVLIGDMGLVGPRPELPYYTDRYTKKEKEILKIRPGITDLGSLEFHSLGKCVGDNDVDRFFEKNILAEKNRLRLEYVQRMSLWLDLKILTKTAGLILKKLWTI